MKSAVIIFPGLNRDRDMIAALTKITGHKPQTVWHADATLPDVDLVVIPGGFSYGDYLRAGAIAARAPIMDEIANHAKRGGLLLGVCNGFQILTETGMLPGALLRNRDQKFICKQIHLRVERTDTAFTKAYSHHQVIACPVAHHDGNYFAAPDVHQQLLDENSVAFRYCAADGSLSEASNPNGSIDNIAGITNKAGNILGMMPHPENLIEDAHGGTDGRGIIAAALDQVA